MAIKQYRKTYNDGYLIVQEMKTIRNTNKKAIGREPVEIMRLRFAELSFRETDVEVCNGLGKKLDIKVETPYPPHFKSRDVDALTIALRDQTYSIIKTDRSKQNLYMYLQRVGDYGESDRGTNQEAE
ncbi:phage head-tail adapter protein [Bacillus mycoides]|uniref:phage head-tail adapter protein n=1 Tax=Bacillus TaxID=1386 RepID=UPI001C032C74|nr:phage head-tail adapter protein [Bacillus mycoides]MED1382070.1 phage head-tail adapter protein [Bacillus mycoides]QWH77294.1 phage head-tail adapter protein [Bacillus mycoides]QWI42343.1 phage head-tail adapter protein [Bacillus mycoides]